MQQELEIKDKFLITVKDASVYFNIGQKRIRRIAEDDCVNNLSQIHFQPSVYRVNWQ